MSIAAFRVAMATNKPRNGSMILDMTFLPPRGRAKLPDFHRPPPSVRPTPRARLPAGPALAARAAILGRLTRPPERGVVAGMETVFDTLAYTRRLTQAGVEAKHAEALTDALRAAFSEGVATKADIARLEARMDALEANMRAMQWVLGLIAALCVMMAARLFGVL